MIAPSVSDMLKVLDKIPEWVGLKRLLGRIDTLEKRVADLEAQLKVPAKPAGEICPICDEGRLKVTKVEPDPVFGDKGVQQHTLACMACGHTETRQVDPSKRR